METLKIFAQRCKEAKEEVFGQELRHWPYTNHHQK
jgi:hypothetical protein